jgi:LuxR family maltose regulon positive regulatory protein
MCAAAELSSPRRARLRAPRLPGDVVVRPRLLNRLNRSAALSLVIAPAGYGKTTLVTTWLSELDLPHAWLGLDADENQLPLFLSAIITAMGSIVPNFGAGILEMLYSPNTVSVGDLTVLLVNELNAVEQEFVLVLEDYHAIREPSIHQLLQELVNYPPHGMHLVLISRYDPPLTWRTRTRADMCELRAGDLGFTPEEAVQFLAMASDQSVSDADARTLVEQSQGWITSLRLAALAMRRQDNGATWSTVTTSSLRNFDDYFNAELLSEIPPSTIDFLLRTSILNLLSGPLCDYVAGPMPGNPAGGDELPVDGRISGSSGALLRDLERVGAFTAVLDDEGAWYRYHPLLRSALRRKLEQTVGGAEINALYARASAWHEEQGLLDEALTYALASKEITLAVGLLQRYRHQLLNRFDWLRLTHWLEQFPTEAIVDHVELILTKSWVNFWRYNLPETAVDLERLESLLSELAPDDPYRRASYGEMMALRTKQHMFAGDPLSAFAAAQQAVADLPKPHFYVRSTAMLDVIVNGYMCGQRERTIALNETFAAEEWVPRDLARARFLQALTHAYLLATNLTEVRSVCPQWLDVIAARNFKTNRVWTFSLWASACYLQNDLHEAAEHFSAALELVDYAHAQAYTQSAIGLALTCQARGLAQEASAVIDGARRSLEARQQYYMLTIANAFAAELAARQGRVEEAMRWIVREGAQRFDDIFPSLFAPGLACVRILLGGNSRETLRQAQLKLHDQMELAVRTHNVLNQIHSHALQAALSAAAGDRAGAVVALKQALALAEHGQVSRIFLDLAAPLAPLFDAIAANQPLSGFALRVCNAIQMEHQGLAFSQAQVLPSPAAPKPAESVPTEDTDREDDPTNDSAAVSAAVSAAGESDLQELLTYREMDVLKLLEERLSNKEIAHLLGISSETVRQHTVNLFRKLNVDNRRQAVVVARRMRQATGG